MTRSFFLAIIMVTTISAVSYTQEIQNWTHFRGSNLNGLANDGYQYPVQWNDSVNIAWKAEIEGKGWSSPIVSDNQIWCTTATPDGKEMSIVCLNFETGSQVFNIPLFQPDSIFRIHAVNSYATPTPCMDEHAVYAHFGRYGTAGIDRKNGKIRWKRMDLECNHVQGPGSSPILYMDKLILHLEGTDVQDIYALDKNTGETLWKTSRPRECYDDLLEIGKKAYITPIVVRVDGKDMLISNGSAVCIAYDIETGKEIWRIPQGEDSTISMPVEWNGILFFYTSFVTTPDKEKYCELLAIDPKGQGDISQSNILWRKESPILQLLTPVVDDGLLYTIDSRGMLSCIDAQTGEEFWTEKLRGKYHSSPVIANGHVYFSSIKGTTLVYRTGQEKIKVAENAIHGDIWTTPAFLEGHILLRTSKYIYNLFEN